MWNTKFIRKQAFQHINAINISECLINLSDGDKSGPSSADKDMIKLYLKISNSGIPQGSSCKEATDK